LDDVNDDILDFYIHVLNTTGVNSVGPMLRIDDIPDYYPRKQMLLMDMDINFGKDRDIGCTIKIINFRLYIAIPIPPFNWHQEKIYQETFQMVTL
jgi:hypothetical protein